MARTEVDRMDLLCTEHNNATLRSKTRVTLLEPCDKYSGEIDFSMGWQINLEELECPVDPEGDCVDSWKAFLVT